MENNHEEVYVDKEREYAIKEANRLLDEPWVDPDDTLRMLSRQFLRSIEREEKLRSKCISAAKDERERINQYFSDKADYDTDTDCHIITERIYHKAFNPGGCGSDGKGGKNHCTDCYSPFTKDNSK